MSSTYDVVVVGSGIGGLVAANYLAKTSKKVLVVEKNREVGGYCTSFNRRGYLIDTTIHAVQNCSRGNLLFKIFSELGLYEKMNFIRANPTDSILIGDNKIDIYNNFDETLNQFYKCFPKEKRALENFFFLFQKQDLRHIYAKYKTKTLSVVLDEYFNDENLKKSIGVLLSNIGSLPENTSMLTAYALLKQFIFYGGYYPKGGMQTIPDVLTSNLKKMGGEVLLKTNVTKIITSDRKVRGIVVDGGKTYFADNIVANCDLKHAFEDLLDYRQNKMFVEMFNQYKPSMSIYIVYLLLRKKVKEGKGFGAGVWCVLPDQVIENQINLGLDSVMTNKAIFISIASNLDETLSPPGKDYVRLMINTMHKSQSYWAKNTKILNERLISKARKVLPSLEGNIECVGRATSWTMKNYSNNSDGAVCGWWNTPEQVLDPVIKHLPNIEGLYFAGHWVSQSYGCGGVAMAAETGRKAFKKIQKNCYG